MTTVVKTYSQLRLNAGWQSGILYWVQSNTTRSGVSVVMTSRTYAPDYVSDVTLAYRLDCPVEAIEGLIRRGVLPRPQMIGELRRWDFAMVRAAIESQNGGRKRLAPNGQPGADEDPFLAALAPEGGSKA
jgi:hypothetical protein